MPPPEQPGNSEFRAPGASVEGATGGTRLIQGVSTSTAAFVGPTLNGPADAIPNALSSFAEYQAAYGDLSDISFSGPPQQTTRNYLALAARAFFENGGQRLYVARVTSPGGGNTAPPTVEDYTRTLSTLRGFSDLSVVAAPGGMIAGDSGLAAVAPIHSALIAHVSQPGAGQFAVLDPPPDSSTSDMETLRACTDSINAAIYYPWVTIANPFGAPAAAIQIKVPPSGFLCGVYARVDTQLGVFKAPADQAILGAIGFERKIASLESDTLNAVGINCLRSFPGRGNLVWGARTISSDTEWRYVSIRRYFFYLERSIDQGTQWVVFEQNGEQLWAAVQQTVSEFLHNEWSKGALQGATPQQAWFVRCDRTTMTQDDIDNGRLICEIGIAPLKPAEFIIFRIAQKTAGGTTP